MALTIRLSAREVADLKNHVMPNTLVEKVLAAEMRASVKASSKGLAPQVAIEAFREVLGSRLVLPLPGQYGQVGVLLRNLGLSRLQCQSIAKTAAAEWRPGPIRVLSLLRQADVLLGGAQGNLPGTSGAPLGLEE